MAMEDTKSLKTILKNTAWCLRLIFRSNRVLFTSVFIFGLFVSITPFFQSRVFSQLIDSLVYNQNGKTYWIPILLLFIGIMAINSTFFYLQTQFSRVLDIQLQAHLRKLFINKVTSLDYQHLEGKDTSNLISKVDEEFGWRIRQTLSDANSIFTSILSLLAVSAILLPKFPFLWLIIFLSQVPQYFFQKYWVQKDWQIHEKNSDKTKLMWDLNWQLRQKNYIAELRINNAIKFLFQKFSDSWDFFANSRTQLRVQQTPTEFSLIAFSTLINAFCLYSLISSTHSGLITIGLFTFYFQSISQTANFFRSLVFSSVSVTENSYHIGNFKKVLTLKNSIKSGPKIVSNPHPPKIEFKNVSFKYPGTSHYIYRNLNLTINPQEEIAIVGQNGAGKSTLIKLLCHFYEPNSGQILINGVDLKLLKLDSWYRQLSFLAQEFNSYYNLTLRESIFLGRPQNQNDQKILTALKQADASFTKRYHRGLDTPMSQRYGGEEPSWGQSQKLAIARVFYRNSPIIILDEPTASIDAVSESKIFNRLYKTIKNKTLIIVSHRFSTVRNAQRIIVINQGKIVEQGTHQQLLALKGLYARSFHLQAKGYTQT
jgi:ABC-type multidrug transport system fused ATPase/permease subunit